MNGAGPELVVSPPGPAWSGLLDTGVRTRSPGWRENREALGLPADRPIVMTGHQATIWHPGVLAKFIAIDRFAEHTGAAPVWLIVDQDEHEFTPLRAPAFDGSGALIEEKIALVDPPPLGGAAVADVPALPARPLALKGRPAAASVERGLRSIEDGLKRHAPAPNAARQIAGALLDLARPLLRTEPRVIFATDLATTPLFLSLVGELRNDPARAVRLHNEAARATRGSTIRELALPSDAARIELPLWRLGDGPRRRVLRGQLDAAPAERLAPAALLMTALLRLAACDLFVHGTGGGAYDRVTERWVRAWLGAELAPMAVVSATVLLPLAESAATEADLARAAWRAHRARHDPRVLGDEALGAWKRAAAAEIERAKASGGDAAALFRTMHERLEAWRREHGAGIAAIDGEVEIVRRKLAARDVAGDRTWAFPLHDEPALAGLAGAVEGAFALSRA